MYYCGMRTINSHNSGHEISEFFGKKHHQYGATLLFTKTTASLLQFSQRQLAFNGEYDLIENAQESPENVETRPLTEF